MKKYFHFAFEISRSIIFEISYYKLGGNNTPYFTTSAAQFNRPKTDFNHCGQAQKELLKGYNTAMNFYKKFDPLHLQDLIDSQYTEISEYIEKLKLNYNWMESDKDISFSQLRELFKTPIKKNKTQVLI